MTFVTTLIYFEYIMLSEVRERQFSYGFTYIWNLKNRENKTKSRLTDRKNRLVVAKREGVGDSKWVKGPRSTNLQLKK